MKIWENFSMGRSNTPDQLGQYLQIWVVLEILSSFRRCFVLLFRFFAERRKVIPIER